MAARMRGKVQPGSGKGRYRSTPMRASRPTVGGKGDVSSELLLTECKTTAKASISLKQAHLIKISREADHVRKSPAMVLSFPTMPEGVENDWLVVPLSVWQKLHGRLDDAPGGLRS